MTKKESLADKIKARRRKGEPGRNKGVVAVLAQKEEISDALSQGFTMREIHTVLVEEGKMPVGYNAFTRLVNIYIKGKKQPKVEPTQETEQPPEGEKKPTVKREPLGIEQLKKNKGRRKDHVYDEHNYDIDDLV